MADPERAATPPDDVLLRATVYGPVHGVDDAVGSGTWYWKGIPYAQAPVGALRWKAPREPAAWSAPRPAHTFGDAPLQYGRIYGPGRNNCLDDSIRTSLNAPVGSEDCLSLNIWRPANGDTGLPVIVYVFGGSNVSGYSADPLYDGANLARSANAVVVTLNYRVGVFGWLHLPQLACGDDPRDDSGNFGLLDIIQALAFVNRSIAAFGGDTANITVMGQSAGAINVYALLTSPLVVQAPAPLFQRAIALSGGISLASNLASGCIPTLQTVAAAQLQAQSLLVGLLIAQGQAPDPASASALMATWPSQELANFLRAQSPEDIFRVLLTQLAPQGLASSGPIPEGVVVAANPIEAIRAGHYLRVPVLAGNTRDEAKLFARFLALSPQLGGIAGLTLDDAELFEAMVHFAPDAPDPGLVVEDLVHPAYLPSTAPGTGYNARTDVLNRLLFWPSRDNVLNALKAQQEQVWHYQFNWDQEPAPWDQVYGAAHALDLPFLFGNFGPSLFSNVLGGAANRPGRLALSAAMVQRLSAFVRTDNPNAPSLGPYWPTWPQSLALDAGLQDLAVTVV